MQDFTSIDRLQDATVFDSNGDKVGSVGQVYLDDATNEPTFVTVKTGLFGLKETFVPLNQASQAEEGLTVPFEKDFIKDAPNVDADGSLTPEEEQRIYEYYSLDYTAGQGHDDVDVAGETVQDDAAPVSDDRAAATGVAAGSPAATTVSTDATGTDVSTEDQALATETVESSEPHRESAHDEHVHMRDDASRQTGKPAGVAGGAGVGQSHDHPLGTVEDGHDVSVDQVEGIDVATQSTAASEYRLRRHTFEGNTSAAPEADALHYESVNLDPDLSRDGEEGLGNQGQTEEPQRY